MGVLGSPSTSKRIDQLLSAERLAWIRHQPHFHGGVSSIPAPASTIFSQATKAS